nr:hypothetical protein Iba_chr04dCG4110 [Ipomoea batatas]
MDDMTYINMARPLKYHLSNKYVEPMDRYMEVSSNTLNIQSTIHLEAFTIIQCLLYFFNKIFSFLVKTLQM